MSEHPGLDHNAYAAFELLPDATVAVRGDGTIAYCNGLAARLLELRPEALEGRPAQQALPLVDEAGLDWWECVRPLDGDPHLVARIAEADVQLATPGCRRRPLVLTGARHGEHAVDLVVLSLRRGERRRRLDAARSELVSTVSHELRSPLTSVKGFTKTLLAKWERFSDAQKRQMLETVNEDADRVTRLLGELLDVSRIDAGRLQLRRQMVDLSEVVDKVLDRVGALGDDGLIRAELPELPKLYADPDKLGQVVTNLVENGLKYGEGTVRITADVDGEAVRVTVSDAGVGIEADHLARIFTKFFRRPGERRTGTGLGLYISRGIILAHGGRIWAESTPGEGSRFRFTLPLGGLELADVHAPPTRPESP